MYGVLKMGIMFATVEVAGPGSVSPLPGNVLLNLPQYPVVPILQISFERKKMGGVG